MFGLLPLPCEKRQGGRQINLTGNHRLKVRGRLSFHRRGGGIAQGSYDLAAAKTDLSMGLVAPVFSPPLPVLASETGSASSAR
jgi:hypothetical protein